jgi:hypothetical protein
MHGQALGSGPAKGKPAMQLSFFRRPHTEAELPELKPGDSYRRPRRDRVAETATVLTLCADPVGIPHVRFNVAFDHIESGRLEGGMRILALRAFCEAYSERV